MKVYPLNVIFIVFIDALYDNYIVHIIRQYYIFILDHCGSAHTNNLYKIIVYIYKIKI